ncbi:MAG: HPr(Ser) kinase/phosphatase [Acidobacteria bacterium]|nr:HPr(Ser) kinase/phosphatase [Acidobacteriota bacterium]
MTAKRIKRVRLKARELLSEKSLELGISLLCGKRGLKREITHPRIKDPGLILAGNLEYLEEGSLLLLGEKEVLYLKKLSGTKRSEVMVKICSTSIAGIIIAGGLVPPPEVIEIAEQYQVPLFSTSLCEDEFRERINSFLDNQLAPRTVVHGVLVDLWGVGVLIIGESGIGKSECALDLVVRGHRLVADDVIEIRRRSGNILIGRGPEPLQHFLELRGLGIVDIKELFGVASTRRCKRVELVVALERWEENEEYDRLGLEELRYEILGVKLPLIKLPIVPGRNLSILIEVAARNHLLKLRGEYPAREFIEHMERRMMEPAPPKVKPSEEDLE